MSGLDTRQLEYLHGWSVPKAAQEMSHSFFVRVDMFSVPYLVKLNSRSDLYFSIDIKATKDSPDVVSLTKYQISFVVKLEA